VAHYRRLVEVAGNAPGPQSAPARPTS
jgi:hypothetical protein